MKTTKLTLLIFLLLPLLAVAQNRITIKDFKTGEPLSGATILLKRTSKQTLTNESGVFDLQALRPVTDKDTLIVSNIGYDKEIILVSDLKNFGYTILLKLKVEQLGQAVVKGREPELLASVPFKELANIPEWVSEFGSTLTGDKIYVVGGNISINEVIPADANPIGATKPVFQWISYSDKMYVYDIPTDTWSISDQLFSKRANLNVHSYNGKIYVLGGKRNSRNKKQEYLSDRIEVYDIAKDTLIVGYSNPHQAVSFASVLVDKNLILLGGSEKKYNSGTKVYSNKGHMLDLSTGYWYELPEMPKDQASEMDGVAVGNTVYLIGGYKDYPFIDIRTYDISTGEYAVVRKFPEGISHPAISYDGNSTIYIYNNQILYCFDVNTTQLKAYKLLIDLASPQMFFRYGELYILGGKRFGNPSNKLFKVDVSELRKVNEYSIYNR